MTKKVVLKVGVHDEKEKKKALKAVSSLTGIESLAMDMKDKKLTVVGEVDPVEIVGKLKKSCHCHTELLTVGPAKEPEKKKEEPKKEEPGKAKTEAEKIEELLQLYKTYYPQTYCVYSAEENPNSCVIC